MKKLYAYLVSLILLLGLSANRVCSSTCNYSRINFEISLFDPSREYLTYQDNLSAPYHQNTAIAPNTSGICKSIRGITIVSESRLQLKLKSQNLIFSTNATGIKQATFLNSIFSSIYQRTA
ncbi:hypothetical protein Q2T41_07450 [Maribacter confluentis]|uniref:Uncharacterized protein n=1 Tax=Maribacter confluentis TaxID=1656093 RepID=A0ABT8RNJ2_9FLAO|nr:hypothetical protein [Maribacter confluentis]MDO1512485.1 hypothetical protein [Maribacter confluentis]